MNEGKMSMTRPLCWVVAAVIVVSGLQPVAAKSTKRLTLELESAAQRSPAASAPWLALAHFYAKHEQPAQAALCYVRFLTIETNSEDSKVAASRLWALLVPDTKDASTSISMRPPEGNEDPWWQVELMLSLSRSMRHRGKAATLSDEQYFATALNGLTLFAEGLAKNQQVSSFWRSIAIPYYIEARGQQHVESMAYEVCRSLNRPETAQYLEANRGKIEAFQSWSREWKPGP
jgi:hypothetical protein